MALYYQKKHCGNDLQFVDELINNMIEVLILYGSDDFWKLLKYGTKDALTNPTYTITLEEKAILSDQNNASRKIRNTPFADDIATEQHNEIRIYDGGWRGDDYNYNITIGFDVICGTDITELDTNAEYPIRKNAVNVLQHELLDIFNGSIVSKNVGEFITDNQRGIPRRFNDKYIGITFTLSGVSG